MEAYWQPNKRVAHAICLCAPLMLVRFACRRLCPGGTCPKQQPATQALRLSFVPASPGLSAATLQYSWGSTGGVLNLASPGATDSAFVDLFPVLLPAGTWQLAHVHVARRGRWCAGTTAPYLIVYPYDSANNAVFTDGSTLPLVVNVTDPASGLTATTSLTVCTPLR